MNDKTLKQVQVILLFGILLIIFSPFLFTRSVGIIDFTNTGQIGDTIGGITAPIASLLGSILVFFALKAQIEANRLIQRQIEDQQRNELINKQLQNLLDQFKIIREDVNEFSFLDKNSDYDRDNRSRSTQFFQRRGAEAFHNVLSDLRILDEDNHSDVLNSRPKFSEMMIILQCISSYLTQVASSEIPRADKEYLFSQIKYLFDSKFRAPFNAHERYRRNEKVCERCGKIHNRLINRLFIIRDEIENKIALPPSAHNISLQQ